MVRRPDFGKHWSIQYKFSEPCAIFSKNGVSKCVYFVSYDLLLSSGISTLCKSLGLGLGLGLGLSLGLISLQLLFLV
jgi:hypothetical protein